MSTERIPITKDMLVGDSIQSKNNLTDILESINSSNFEALGNDKRHAIEDAFIRRYASLWSLKYRTLKGKPMTYKSKSNPFANRPWQQQILDDSHPNKVVEKSRQLGLSETSVTELIHFLAMHDNTKAMYTFPTYTQMQDFSVSRISPVFKSNPVLQDLLSKEVNNVGMKKVGNSYLFMRSSSSGSIGEGVDTDCAYFDELDRMPSNVFEAFAEGLKSSQYGLVRRWSTPTTPGFGVNALYQKTDQMRYIHTCQHCGHKQFLTAEDNIFQVNPNGVNNASQEIEDGTFIIGCSKCHRELDRWEEGVWVPTYPSIKEMRGYHISQLDATWISADDIMRRKFNYSSKQLFYNYVLGEPYANEGLIIYENDVKNCIRIPKEVVSRTSEYVGIAAGIDWGEPSWLVVLGLRSNGSIDVLNIYWAESNPVKPLADAAMLTAILRAYKPNIIVADAGYGADKNSYMYTQFPNAFYACQWQTSKDSRARIKFIDQWNERAREVNVDKTVKIQRTLHAVKNATLGLFPWGEKADILAKHLNNTRILDDEDNGIVFQKAVRVGPDHTVCSLTYAMIGMDKLTNYSIALNSGFRAEFI